MNYPPQSPQSARIILAHTVRHAATTLDVAVAAVAGDGNQNRHNSKHRPGTCPACWSRGKSIPMHGDRCPTCGQEACHPLKESFPPNRARRVRAGANLAYETHFSKKTHPLPQYMP